MLPHERPYLTCTGDLYSSHGLCVGIDSVNMSVRLVFFVHLLLLWLCVAG